MKKIIIVCSNKNKGSDYMRELIKQYNLINIKYSDFAFVSDRLVAKSVESSIPFIAIPFDWCNGEEMKKVKRLSVMLRARRHSEIEGAQIQACIDEESDSVKIRMSPNDKGVVCMIEYTWSTAHQLICGDHFYRMYDKNATKALEKVTCKKCIKKLTELQRGEGI